MYAIRSYYVRLFVPQEFNEYVMGGGSRTVTRYVDMGQSVTVNGWSHEQKLTLDQVLSTSYNFV